MRRLIFSRPIFLALFVLAFAVPANAQANLQGSWTAAEAVRDGKVAEDVIGHRLVFAGSRFEIRSKEGKLLFSGTIRTNTAVQPATIDFEHKQGSLSGKAWKGIYSLDGGTLRVIDNAPDLKKARPAFDAGPKSGYVLVTFRPTGR